MATKLLLVDDEPAVLRSLSRLLIRKGFELITANSAPEALEYLATHEVHIVLSDFRMPVMDGGMFAREVQAHYPQTVFMILSAHADLSLVIDALNSGAVFRFMCKPWDRDDLYNKLAEAEQEWGRRKWERHERSLLTHTAAAMIELDGQGNITDLNEAAAGLVPLQGLPAALPGVAQNTLQAWLSHAHIQSHEVVVEGQSLQYLMIPSAGRWIVRVQHTEQLPEDTRQPFMDRQAFVDKLAVSLATGAVTLVCLDINNFKYFNNCFGHLEADRLLNAVGFVLEERLTEKSDVLAKISGDLFAVAFLGEYPLERVESRIAHLLAPFEQLFSYDSRDLHLSFSVGYAQSPQDAECADALLSCALDAMYVSKLSAEVWVHYDEKVAKSHNERLALQSDLFRALERQEITVAYQPKISLKTGRIVGAEALMRWNHPERGAVPPSTFIPIAEMCGLIDPLGDYILSQAIEHSQAWPLSGTDEFTLSVNLSGRQLQAKGLSERVSHLVAGQRLKGVTLELEVTESYLIQDLAYSREKLAEIKALGIRLAIDDFGTGYSSISYLSKLPFDTLKIDRSFIAEIAVGQNSYHLVNSIVRMAHELGLRVIAEGIETQDQLSMLQQMGCHEMQGFYFSPAISAAEFNAMLLQGNVALNV